MTAADSRRAECETSIRNEDIAQRLRQQILSDLHLGRLAPTQRLPSTRVLAAQLGVDPRRIARAYRELVIDGLVDLRPRSGFYVAANGNGRHRHAGGSMEWAIDALLQAGDREMSPVDVADRLRASLTSRRVTAACVECNDDQLFGLAEELKLDYGFATYEVALERVGDAAARSTLRGVDLLVTTAFHSAETRRLARDVGKPSIAITIRPELRKWMQEALSEGDVYLVASDDRFAVKARAMFADLCHTHQIRVLVTGRDDLSTIPVDAPTYVTRRARHLLSDRAVSSRVLWLPRLFSRESRREILTYVIESNTLGVGNEKERHSQPRSQCL